MRTKVVIIAMTLVAIAVGTASARVPRKNPSAYDMGTEAYDNQQYEQAIAWMEQALEKNEDNGFALAYKGSALRLLDRYAESADVLGRAVGLIDDVNTTFRAWTHAERCYALLELHDTVAALDEINKAIDDNSREAIYWQNRAAIHGRQFRFEQALADYEQALLLSPDDDDLRQQRDRALKSREYFSHRNDPEYCAERDTTAADEVVLPQYPGGNTAMNEYINSKTGWDKAKRPVRVTVEALIDAQGNVAEARIVSGINKKLDNKALEICKGLKHFSPATHHGQPVECSIMIPVRFVDPN